MIAPIDLTADEMRALKPAHREIIAVVIDGTSYADIAAALNIPLGTVRSRLSRARAALAKLRGQSEVEAAA